MHTARNGIQLKCLSRAGHTAVDPAALSPAGVQDYGRFLHVRGKSELKHTAQLLDCWARHPDWPTLTVIGCACLARLLFADPLLAMA